MYRGRVILRPWRVFPYVVQGKAHWWSRWEQAGEYKEMDEARLHAVGLCSERVVWPVTRGSIGSGPL